MSARDLRHAGVGTLGRVTSKKRANHPRPSRAQRRKELLDAAVEAIRTIGAGASMEQIAAQGGVTKPILYRHFADRDGLIGAIGERYGVQLIGRLDSALDADEPEELLWRTIDGYLAFLEEDPELYRFLMQQGRRPGLPHPESTLIAIIGRQVASVISDRLRANGLDASGAEPLAFGIVGMVHQAGDWWLRDKAMSRQALSTHLAGLLWVGFVGMGSGAGPFAGRAVHGT